MDQVIGANCQAVQQVPVEHLELPGQSGDSGYLLGHLLRFGQLLRLMGVDVSTRQIIDLVEALEHVSIADRFDFYYTCRALLVNRREDFPVFEQAFAIFWRAGTPGLQAGEPPPDARVKQLRLPSKPQAVEDTGEEDAASDGERPGAGKSGDVGVDPMMIYSPQEVLREKDFCEMTWEEIQEAKRALSSLEWKLGYRRTRRLRRGPRGRLNLRRMARDNLRHGGEPISLAYRQRVERPRSLVILCDTSGSMERYSRMLLHFVHALTHGLMDTTVEAFVFGTRLARITHHLRHRDVDESLGEMGRVIRSWSGGTRIGEALKDFNFRWARRVLGRGAVVLVISDGWDRGNLDLLGQEMARLQRTAYRLIWLNPLLGSDEYSPVQRGMATAMPYVDDFLPVHNLASLEQLADLLSSVAALRPARRQIVRSSQLEAARSTVQKSASRRATSWSKPWAARVSQPRRGIG
jgi:uncharacterized protein with von Willebrand factor type A (vWA) domain